MAEDPDIDELIPASEELDEDDLYDLANAGIEDDDVAEDVEIIEPAPRIHGRNWLFNFTSGRFDYSGRSPRTVRGDANLYAWIEKCLRSVKGASVVQHPDYGLEQPLGDYIGGDPDDLWELEADLGEALAFHPAIQSIEDVLVELGQSPYDEIVAEISFRVLLGDAEELEFSTQITTEDDD